MPRRRRVVLGMLALLAVGACDDAEPVADGQRTPPALVTDARSARPSGLSGPGGSPRTVTEWSLPAAQDAPETAVEVVRSLPYRDGQDPTVTPLAVSPSGEVLVSTFDPGSFDAGALELLATMPVQLWTEDGLEPMGSTEALVPGDAHRQVASGAFAGGSPAWHETTGVGVGTSDWRIVARPGDAPVLLARSEQLFPAGELPGFGDSSRLAAVGDRVGWETAAAREDGTVRTRLVSVPVTGGELRVEAELAAVPAGAADGWVVVRLEDVDAAGMDEGGQPLAAQTTIDLVAPGGRVRTLVELRGVTVSQLAAGGGEVLAWADGTDVYAGATGGTAIERLAAAPGTSVVPESLMVCGERVVWALSPTDGPATTYVRDPSTGEVATLPTVPGDAPVVCGGDYLAWTEPVDGGGVVTLARFTGTG